MSSGGMILFVQLPIPNRPQLIQLLLLHKWQNTSDKCFSICRINLNVIDSLCAYVTKQQRIMKWKECLITDKRIIIWYVCQADESILGNLSHWIQGPFLVLSMNFETSFGNKFLSSIGCPDENLNWLRSLLTATALYRLPWSYDKESVSISSIDIARNVQIILK